MNENMTIDLTEQIRQNRKIYNKSLTKFFVIATFLLLMVVVLKILFCTLPVAVYIAEIIPLLLSFVYCLLCFTLKKISLKRMGEFTSDIKNCIFANAFWIEVFFLIFNMFLKKWTWKKYERWIWSDIVILLVLFLMILISSIKGSLPMLHRSQKEINQVKKIVRIGVVPISVVLAIVHKMQDIIKQGSLDVIALVLTVFTGFIVGIFIYAGIITILSKEEQKLNEWYSRQKKMIQ